MLRFSVSCVALVILSCPVFAQALADDEVKDGFFRLIDGKGFSGWRFSGTMSSKDKKAKAKPFTTVLDVFQDNWKAGDGMIQLLKGGNPNLATQWDFDDFDVRLQWRALKPTYNSGFYVRSGKTVGANQINLNSKAVGELINTLPALKGKGPGVPDLHKVGGSGEWNDWRVLADGKKLQFWVNGKKAWEVDDFAPARGYLGLQAEGTIDFRDMRVKELGYDLYRTPADFQGNGWTAKDDILVGSSKLTIPKKYAGDYTVRIEFRGKGGLTLGQTSIPFAHDSLKGLLHPADQFNYLQVSVANGKAKLWLNTEDIKGDIPVDAGPIAIVPTGDLELRHVRVRGR